MDGPEVNMRITLLNYAIPERHVDGIRWWHKSGSRWPATILNRRNDGQDYFPWPWLLSYLASMLRSDGHSVELIDACIEQITLDEVEKKVTATKPNFIIFETSEQTEYCDPSVLKRICRVAPIIVIGPNITEKRTDILSWPGVFAAVPGEYLLSTLRLVGNLHRGFADRFEVFGQDQMDRLPFAYRDVSWFPRYSARFKTTPPGNQGQFVSMWGCQHRCNFCIWVHSYWSNSTQMQKQFSIPRLEAEIDQMLHEFPYITSLYDDADNHFYHNNDAYKFAEMMARKKLPWAILTRPDTYSVKSDIDRELWRAYRDSGCYAVKIGIEGCQEIMDLTNKHLSEELVREFVPFMQDLGINVYASFIFGVPGSSSTADETTSRLIGDLSRYKPELFEYIVSYCDITRTTPLANTKRRSLGPHDGQADVERFFKEQGLPTELQQQLPRNLS